MRIKRRPTRPGPPLAVETRSAIGFDPYGRPSSFFGSSTTAGVPINDRTALSYAAYYGAVSIISSKIGQVEFFVAEREGRDVLGPAPDHPADWLISGRPNDWQTGYNFRQTAMVHVLTRGNAYAEIIRQGRRPVALELVGPGEIQPRWDGENRLFYQLGNGRTLSPSDVLHFKALGTTGVTGLSPVGLFAETIGLGVAARTYQTATYGNGCRFGGVIEFPAGSKPEVRRQTVTDLESRNQGVLNAGLLATLEGGAKFNPVTMSLVDSEIIATRNLDAVEMARIFNLPPGMLGVADGSTASSAEDQQLQCYQQTLAPWIKMLEDELHAKLFGRNEFYNFAVTHDPLSLVRGDLAAMSAWGKAMFEMAAISPDEMRAKFGMRPTGNNHRYLATNNYEPVSGENPSGVRNAPPGKSVEVEPAPKPEETEPAGEPEQRDQVEVTADPEPIDLGAWRLDRQTRRAHPRPPFLEFRGKAGMAAGGCGTGAGGFKPGNKCAGTGRTAAKGPGGGGSSIGDAPERSPLDSARDAFSAAKLDHNAALAEHRKAPNEATAAKLEGSRSALGTARDGYRSAHEGGRIENRALDAQDPRIRQLRAERTGDYNYGAQADGPRTGKESRKALEDRVLMKVPSPLPVAHHYGESPPKLSKDAAPEVKRLKKEHNQDRAEKPVRPEDEAMMARITDHAASRPGKPGEKSFLTYDRISGSYGNHVTDYSLNVSPRNRKGIASGRLELLKAYQDGKEIPITDAIRDEVRRPRPQHAHLN